jgi:hypothetical protein
MERSAGWECAGRVMGWAERMKEKGMGEACRKDVIDRDWAVGELLGMESRDSRC